MDGHGWECLKSSFDLSLRAILPWESRLTPGAALLCKPVPEWEVLPWGEVVECVDVDDEWELPPPRAMTGGPMHMQATNNAATMQRTSSPSP